MVDEFLQSFLTISDYRTVIFLAVLAVLFWAIHYLYRMSSSTWIPIKG